MSRARAAWSAALCPWLLLHGCDEPTSPTYVALALQQETTDDTTDDRLCVTIDVARSGQAWAQVTQTASPAQVELLWAGARVRVALADDGGELIHWWGELSELRTDRWSQASARAEDGSLWGVAVRPVASCAGEGTLDLGEPFSQSQTRRPTPYDPTGG